MDLQLKEKIIIVTGGAKGIGEGIGKTTATEGAVPVIIGRNEKDNLQTVTADKKCRWKILSYSGRTDKT